MPNIASDIAFSPAVKAIQQQRGSRDKYARMEQSRGWPTALTQDLISYIAQLDMFYLATASAAGRPYVQYRGGPPGFLKVLDERTLAFADFAGNRQYITVGNLSENPRAFIFLIDYANQRRVKLWGTARTADGPPDLLTQLADPTYSARVERAIIFTLDAWDENCDQHIHRRLPASEVAAAMQPLVDRIAALESALRAAGLTPPD